MERQQVLQKDLQQVGRWEVLLERLRDLHLVLRQGHFQALQMVVPRENVSAWSWGNLTVQLLGPSQAKCLETEPAIGLVIAQVRILEKLLGRPKEQRQVT